MTARVRTIAFRAHTPDKEVIREHRWTADYAICEVTILVREQVRLEIGPPVTLERRYTMDVTPGGVVVASEMPLGEYARERMESLARTCDLDPATITLTDLDIEHEPIPTDGGGHSTHRGP